LALQLCDPRGQTTCRLPRSPSVLHAHQSTGCLTDFSLGLRRRDQDRDWLLRDTRTRRYHNLELLLLHLRTIVQVQLERLGRRARQRVGARKSLSRCLSALCSSRSCPPYQSDGRGSAIPRTTPPRSPVARLLSCTN